MPTEWYVEKAATMLMWSGTEVTQAILGNGVINGNDGIDVKDMLYGLAHVCATQDREEKSTHYLRCDGGNECI